MTVLQARPVTASGPDEPSRFANLLRPKILNRAALIVFILILGYLIITPLIKLQREAFSDGAAGYSQAFGADRIGRTIGYTIGLSLGSLVIALVLGTALAWAASRLPSGLGFLRIVPILPIVVPAVASVAGWAFLFSPRPGYLNALLRKLPWWSDLTEGPVDVYTLPWIVFITGIGLSSFVFLFVSAGFQNINSEILEAAQVSGSSQVKVFFKVTLPLLRPTLIYGGSVAFLLGLGQFTAPLLLGTNSGVTVITTEMYFLTTQTPVQTAAAAALGSPLMVIGLLLVLFQKLALGNQKRFVTHGGKAFRSSGRPSWLGASFIILYFVISTALPITALTFVSLSRFWSGKIDLSKLTTANFDSVMSDSVVPTAIQNSLIYSIVAVAIALPVGFIVSQVLVRGQDFPLLRTILDFVVAVPLGVPAVIFGIGFLFTYSEGPFVLYGTPWVLILVYVALMVPFATRMQLSTMLALGDQYIEASRVSGAGRLRTNILILLPLMRSSLAGAAALIFVLLTHEFSASLLVRSSTTQVMGTVLFDFWNTGTYPLAAAVALIMTGVTAIGVGLAVLLGGSESLSKL